MNTTLLVALIGFFGVCITSYFNWRISKNAKNQAEKISEIHVLINSRMSELLRVNKEQSKAEGNLEGRKELAEESKK